MKLVQSSTGTFNPYTNKPQYARWLTDRYKRGLVGPPHARYALNCGQCSPCYGTGPGLETPTGLSIAELHGVMVDPRTGKELPKYPNHFQSGSTLLVTGGGLLPHGQTSAYAHRPRIQGHYGIPATAYAPEAYDSDPGWDGAEVYLNRFLAFIVMVCAEA